jgi:hypothetical protein
MGGIERVTAGQQFKMVKIARVLRAEQLPLAAGLNPPPEFASERLRGTGPICGRFGFGGIDRARGVSGPSERKPRTPTSHIEPHDPPYSREPIAVAPCHSHEATAVKARRPSCNRLEDRSSTVPLSYCDG